MQAQIDTRHARNSAKPCPGDCFLKTQVCANGLDAYGSTSAQCLSFQVNGGRNSDGPKVAKFFAGSLPACMNDVAIGSLSAPRRPLNWQTSEKLQLDSLLGPKDPRSSAFLLRARAPQTCLSGADTRATNAGGHSGRQSRQLRQRDTLFVRPRA